MVDSELLLTKITVLKELSWQTTWMVFISRILNDCNCKSTLFQSILLYKNKHQSSMSFPQISIARPFCLAPLKNEEAYPVNQLKIDKLDPIGCRNYSRCPSYAMSVCYFHFLFLTIHCLTLLLSCESCLIHHLQIWLIICLSGSHYSVWVNGWIGTCNLGK